MPLFPRPIESSGADEPAGRPQSPRQAHRLGSEPAKVWQALTEPEEQGRWLGTVSRNEADYGRLKVRLGEQDYEATVVACDPGMSFDLQWDEPHGRTAVRLAPDNGGTVLTVVAEGRQPGGYWAGPLSRLTEALGA